MLHQGPSHEHDEATIQWIAQDVAYFMKRAMNELENAPDEPTGHVRKRYARSAILLIAFFLESASQRLAEVLPNPDEDWRRREFLRLGGPLPKPLARFRAVHKRLCGEDLSRGLEEVRDIFLIRNRILAHPRGRTPENVAAGGRMKGVLTYRSKYESNGFPKLASQFTPEHAQAVLADAIQFLQRFRDSAVLRIAVEHDRIRKDFDRALSTLEAV